MKRAYEQRPEAVKAWLDEQYPAIEARAKTEGAELHWVDETALVNTDVRGRSFAPKGKTPVTMAVGGTRHKRSMISSVNNRGKAHWMIIDANFDAEKFIEFLTHLHRQVGKKVFVVVDNLRVHHSKLSGRGNKTIRRRSISSICLVTARSSTLTSDSTLTSNTLSERWCRCALKRNFGTQQRRT